MGRLKMHWTKPRPLILLRRAHALFIHQLEANRRSSSSFHLSSPYKCNSGFSETHAACSSDPLKEPPGGEREKKKYFGWTCQRESRKLNYKGLVLLESSMRQRRNNGRKHLWAFSCFLWARKNSSTQEGRMVGMLASDNLGPFTLWMQVLELFPFWKDTCK